VEGDRRKASGPQAGGIQDFTPYQSSLAAMVFPWRFHAMFDLAGALGLALIGAPWLALGWGVGLCAADWVVQRIYRGWQRSAAATDSPTGLRRLASVVLLRTVLWFVAPLAFAILTRSPAAFAFLAVTAISTTALGVSLGWSSPRIFVAMITPAMLSVAAAAVAVLGLAPAAGVLVSLASLFVTLTLIGVGTSRSISNWSQANRRAVEVMAETQAALERSEAAERRLNVAMGIANLHVYEMDYSRRTLTSLGAERDFFEQPLTYKQLWKDPFRGLAPEHRALGEAAWAKYMAGEGPYQAEYRVRRDDGREVWAYATAEITWDEDGNPLTLVGALQNVTERKRGELELTRALGRAEEGSRAKSEFLATMSHEIRTPLNGVLGMAQAMERDELTPQQRKRLAVIRKSGQSLLVLLNGVLDLSKIEAGKLEFDIGEVDIAALARSALDIFDGDAAEKDLQLVLRVAPEAQGLYSGDALRIGQVLHNLVSNAVKFTPQGSVTVSVDRRDETLVIQVADTGIGVSRAHIESLFEKFSQADATVTRRFGGTGLGLAICQQLASMMGGAISVESEEGRGSTFEVTLPLPWLRTGAATGGSAPTPDEITVAGDPSAPLRVLAAEDNPVNQLVLQTLLEQVGVDVVVVADGAEALGAWRRQDWDLILMDIQMPVMDGITASREIRREEAASGRPRTPIIALTANVMSEQVQTYRAGGMDEVVAKPIEVGRLIEAIEAVLAPAPDAEAAAFG
jgi:signal transduction histidine kinase/CheY-like chemotaxis protein